MPVIDARTDEEPEVSPELEKLGGESSYQIGKKKKRRRKSKENDGLSRLKTGGRRSKTSSLVKTLDLKSFALSSRTASHCAFLGVLMVAISCCLPCISCLLRTVVPSILSCPPQSNSLAIESSITQPSLKPPSSSTTTSSPKTCLPAGWPILRNAIPVLI